MSPLLVALLGVQLVPLFVGTWRTSLAGLGLQAALMAAIAHQLDPTPTTAGDWLGLADLVIVRGVLIPFALYGVLRAQNAPARNDVIPPNLLSWTLALGIVLVSFSFASELVLEEGEQQTLVAVACAGVLLGFLVLSSQSGPFSQMIGALRIEYAIALVELGGERHESPLPVHVGLVALSIASIALFRWYLSMLGAGELGAGEPSGDGASGGEGPTL